MPRIIHIDMDLVFRHFLIDDRPNNGAKAFRGEWL